MERIRMRNGFDYISQYVLSICSLLMSEAKAHNVEEEGISPLWFGTRFGTYATTHNSPGLCTSCTCIIPFYMVTPKSLFICNKSQEALSIPLLPTMCASLKFTFDFSAGHGTTSSRPFVRHPPSSTPLSLFRIPSIFLFESKTNSRASCQMDERKEEVSKQNTRIRILRWWA